MEVTASEAGLSDAGRASYVRFSSYLGKPLK